MISIRNVTMKFGKSLAVDGATLNVKQGESVALWGINGAGKTTLIRCVLGLLRYQGSVTIAGHDARRKHARMHVGYVPQELGFYDDLRVDEAVALFARLKRLPSPDATPHLERVGLSNQHRKRIRELSGGMKQRLALAIALLGDPPVLVLDEVTASLDAVGREEFVRLLERLSSEGRTMLFASHRVDEIASLAGRVIVMRNGRIVSEHASAEFVATQSHDAVLHLTIPHRARVSAMDTLRLGGFSPQLNGVGVLVPVTTTQKAAPFSILANAGVPVDDFDLVSVARAAAMLSRPHAQHEAHQEAQQEAKQ